MHRHLPAFLITAALWLWLATGLAGAADPPAAPQLRLDAGMHTATIWRVAADADGRYAATVSDDKIARVWEISSGRLLQVLRPPIGAGNEGKLYAAAISPDGETVAVGGWTGYEWHAQNQVYLFDRASGRLRTRLAGLPNVIDHLTFSPDGMWLAATLGRNNGVRVWSTRNFAAAPLADTNYGDYSNGAAFSADGRLATTSYDGFVRLYQLAPGNLQLLAKRAAPGGKRPYGVAFHPSGRYLAVGYEDVSRVDVLDGASLQALWQPDASGLDSGSLDSVAWSADGQRIVAGGKRASGGGYPVRVWPQGGRGSAQDVPLAGNTVMGLAALPDGSILAGSADPTWAVVDARGTVRVPGRAPVADFRSNFQGFAASRDAREVQFSYAAFGAEPFRFDLANRRLAAGSNASLDAARMSGLDLRDWKDSSQVTLGDRKLPLEAYEWSRTYAIGPDGARFALGTSWSLRVFGTDGTQIWRKTSPGTTWSVNIPAGGRVVIAAYGDGTIRWHRLDNGEELLALFLHADRKRWVIWTPSGYFDAAPGAEELIGWHVNRGQDSAADFYPASRFRERFYRPDVIDRVLDTLDETQALAQADAERGRRSQVVTVAQALPPSVDVLSAPEGTFDGAQLAVRYQIRHAADAPATSVRVRINGKLLETRNLEVLPAGQGSSFVTDPPQALQLALPPENVEIQLFAENRHGVSAPATLRYRYTGRAAPGLDTRGTLYVLAVGVSEYAKPEYRLKLAAKDAHDFAGALQKQKGGLYKDVQVRLLSDRLATRDAIVEGLEWLEKQVGQKDMGVLFLAGHGVNAADGSYYFAPVGFDVERMRSTGLMFTEIRTTLSNLAGKALFFLDTCHSGNVLGGRRALPVDLNGIINELSSAENGVVVFSASTGKQYAIEDPEWGNGAFTKALIEGLSGKAVTAGRVTFKSLDIYVSERVKTLTRGQQHPTTQAPGGVPDFPIALVR
ncbi:MAG: caspase family protein [Rhodocyclaceae bacterium]|nr:caspase family protein [Rhodocyclaceae bacterium]